jgi:hypothetical protein
MGGVKLVAGLGTALAPFLVVGAVVALLVST